MGHSVHATVFKLKGAAAKTVGILPSLAIRLWLQSSFVSGIISSRVNSGITSLGGFHHL